ncbi:MAG: HAD family hydrolase [Actinomycetota bacterium]|nr:HAD family hydrolase [Actinomycetota bacterium]
MTSQDIRELLRSAESNRAALFDLDGTLVDSVADIALALNTTLRARSLPEMSMAELDALMGHPIALILSNAGIEHDLDEAVVEFRSTLVDVMGTHSTVLPGVVEVLNILQARGWQLGVATNKPKHLADLALQRAGLADWFKVIVGAQSLAPKPSAAIPEACLAELDCTGGVMIGDTRMDIEAGHAAGLATIGISARAQEREAMRSVGANLTLTSMAELLDLLG